MSGVLRNIFLSRIVVLATVLCAALWVALDSEVVDYTERQLATLRTVFKFPAPSQDAARHQAENVAIIGCSSLAAFGAYFLALIPQLRIVRLRIRVTPKPNSAFLSAGSPTQVPVRFDVDIISPKTKLGTGLINVLLQRGTIYLSWKEGVPGVFWLGGEDGRVFRFFHKNNKTGRISSHVRIPLTTIRRVEPNSVSSVRFEGLVAPTGPTPQQGVYWTRFRIKWCSRFEIPDGEGRKHTAHQYAPWTRVLLRIFVALEVEAPHQMLKVEVS